MIKKAIGIGTIILVVLVVGVVLTKASPRVDRYRVDNQRLDVTGNYTHSLAVTDRRLDFVRAVERRVEFGRQNVRVLNERFRRNVGRELHNRLVGNELHTVRGVEVGNLPALLDARYRGNHLYLNDRRNLVGRTKHLNVDSYLAVYSLRDRVPRQLENVLSGARLADLRKVPVFGTVEALKERPVDEVLAVPALTSFEVPSVKALRHETVCKANTLVREDTVNVTERLGELDLAVA